MKKLLKGCGKNNQLMEKSMKKIWILFFFGIIYIPQTLNAQQAFPRVGVWNVTSRDSFIIWNYSRMVN